MIPANCALVDPAQVSTMMRAAMFERLSRTPHLGISVGGKMDIYAHQVETALRALEGDRPRLLLSDEVGLGKTIEALLIVKELGARGRADRALFLVPASLVRQWRWEMIDKFDLDPIVIDGSNLDEINLADEGIYLGSIDLAKRRPGQITNIPWDIVVFDEAHHLRRRRDARGNVHVTRAYRLAESLSGIAGALLLLTATPMQLDDFEFYSLLKLIDGHLFPDYDAFLYYHEVLLPRINSVIEHIERDGTVPEGAELVHERTRQLFHDRDTPGLPPSSDLEATVATFRSLVVFPQMMIRHRRRTEFPDLLSRDVRTVLVTYSEEEMESYLGVRTLLRALYQRHGRGTGMGFLATTYQQMLTSSPVAIATSLERYLERRAPPVIDGEETDLATAADNTDDGLPVAETRDFIQRMRELACDSKANALLRLLGEVFVSDPEEKVIIFTRYLETQAYLAQMLSANFKVVTFNGRMNERDKDTNVEAFRRGANVMITTEAGGEGRNFQFCHIMVNYDLPWNPVRLEQRIGRIDRIGQRRRVTVFNLMVGGTIESRIFEALNERVERFVSLVGGSDVILGDVEEDMADIVFDDPEEAERGLCSFIRTLDAKIAKARMATEHFDRLTTFQRRPEERAKASQEAITSFPTAELEEFVINQLLRLGGARVCDLGGSTYEIMVPAGSPLHNTYEISMTATFNPSGSGTHLGMGSILVRNLFDHILCRTDCPTSFERNAHRPRSVWWCFYGGDGSGHCVIETSEHASRVVPPLEVMGSGPSDRDTTATIRSTMPDEVTGAYESARLLAERTLCYPGGGAQLLCVRCVNMPALGGG